ncbi:MAG: thiamine pyrophosphate-binding protein, partial [Alphaproteobacteria bacterium]
RLRRRSGGRLIVDALKAYGVKAVFCVPGESYLAILDALHDEAATVRLVTCRHESGAAFMAEALGKLTGLPGVACVTRGPGACNASIAVHTAFQDSSPMILFVGQVSRSHRGREAFQEVDLCAMFTPLAKWAVRIENPSRIPEVVSHAFHVATSGRPGPVVVSLPEDVLGEEVAVRDMAHYRVVRPHPGAADMEALGDLMRGAQRPLLIAGGGGWTAESCADLRAYVDANGLPATTSFRCQDLIDNTSPNFVGELGIGANPALTQRVDEADLIIAVGCRLGEITTQEYRLLASPRPRQKLVHVHPDPTELERVFQTDLAISAGVGQFAAAARSSPAVDGSVWADWLEGLRRDYLEWLGHGHCPGRLDMRAVMAVLRETLPPEAIITNDAGNFTGWVSRYYQFRRFRTQLGPTNGAMGYGVPAAVAAKIARPEAPVLAFVGDGGALQTGQELATAMMYDLDPVTLVVNNDMYGTIRMQQELSYPGRVSGSNLANPDFVAWAEAYGAHAERVERTDDFEGALKRALKAGRASVLELRLDPEAISTQTTLRALRDQARGE